MRAVGVATHSMNMEFLLINEKLEINSDLDLFAIRYASHWT